MSRTVLTDGRPNGRTETQSIVVEGGRIAEVLDAPPAPQPGETRIDLGGEIVLPGFVDGHAHIDKSLWGEPWVRRTSEEISMRQMFEDTLTDWQETTTPCAVRAARFLGECVRQGTTSVRTLVDVAPQIGLAGVDDVLKVKEAFGPMVDLSVVAFAQLGLLSNPGTAELLDEALSRGGLDGVAGLDPANIDGDAGRSLDAVFGLAAKHGVAVDFHLHESGELGRWLITQIADRAREHGMEGRVSLCDVFSLADASPDELDRTGAVLAEAGIAVAVGVHGLLPVPDVRRLHALGVPMCLGSDSSRSRWSPWGEGDILSRATFLAYKSYFRRDDDLEFALSMGTSLGRDALGLEPCDLAAGDPADLVVLPGQALGEIVVVPPRRTLVMKSGEIVARDGALLHTPVLGD
ncbi:MAG: amidohydrolase family protein [Nocardioides sp.]|uniref:amidohydrolase family protein n=1 Tax=Nocardioides sp. TaxID=35761 RepID=UPI0039E32BFD